MTWMTGAAAGWLGLVALAPLAPPALAAVAYALGALVCHQLPDRSFHLGDIQLAVCARCFGIYAGAAAALAVQVPSYGKATGSRLDRSSVARGVLLVGAMPTVVTVALENAGWWLPSNGVRAVAGVCLGVAIAVVAGGAVRRAAAEALP